MAQHEKTYVICENLCLEEGMTKEEIESTFATQQTVSTLASGSPKGVYETAAALKSSNPATGVYIATGNGHIYSWTKNQSGDPVDLGVYQSTSFQNEFDALMNNINLAKGKLYGNKINAYAIDYRLSLNYTEKLGLLVGWDTTTFKPIIRQNESDLALGLINIDFEIPTSGKITFKRATAGNLQFFLYKENVHQHGRNVGGQPEGWDRIIGYQFNNDGTITLDCAKIRTAYQGGYNRCVAILDKNDRLFVSDEYQIELPDYLATRKIITLKTDGSGDFTSLRAATEYIENNPFAEGYELQVYPGTYNVLSDYTAEEINNAHFDGDATGFCGIIISDNVIVKGIGLKEDIIINGELDPETYDHDVRLQISTLHLIGNCKLENLTVKSNYLRYAIHDDFNANENKIHTIKNCNIINELSLEGVAGGVAYGMGTKSGFYIEFDDCLIYPILSFHNNINFTKSYEVNLNNCKIPHYISINDGNSSVDGYLTINNTITSYIKYTLGNGLTKQYTQIRGNAVLECPIVSNTNLIKYELGHVQEYKLNDNVSFFGKCVSRYTLNYCKRADYKNFDGIYVFNDNGIKYVQSKGYIQTNMLGDTPMSDWTDGDYLTVGSDGYLTKTTDFNTAVAIVTVLDSNNMFIKLI